jgi:hypothetical protein
MTNVVERLGWMAIELCDVLATAGTREAADVEHFCNRLQELGRYASPYAANVGQLLVWLRELVGSDPIHE